MPQHTEEEVERLLAQVAIRPAEIKRKPRTVTPQPQPELDPHVQASYESGEAYELVLPEWAVETTKTKLRKSAKYVGKVLLDGVDIRLTFQVAPAPRNKVTLRFLARPPLDMGRRASREYKAKRGGKS